LKDFLKPDELLAHREGLKRRNLYEAAKRGLRLEAPDIIMPKNVKFKRKGTPIGFRC